MTRILTAIVIVVLLGIVGRSWLNPYSKCDKWQAGFDSWPLQAWLDSDYATGLCRLAPPAELGDADAQYNLARFYERGRDPAEVPFKDKSKFRSETAAKWYRRAADQGHVLARACVDSDFKNCWSRRNSEKCGYWEC